MEQFVSYVGAIVASGEMGESRYLSKNNNNILRLPTIAKAFPDATILIPFRDPIQQANSLLRQHQLFCERHREDPFARNYMYWLGHHEFGLTHRAFRFVENDAISNGDPTDINYWLHVWHDTYAYLLRTRPANANFICYEQLCRKPVTLMAKLMNLIGVEGSAEAYGDAFVSAEHRSTPNVAAELAAHTASLYRELAQSAVLE